EAKCGSGLSRSSPSGTIFTSFWQPFHRSTVPWNGVERCRGDAQETRAASILLSVPPFRNGALKERLKVSFRVTVRSTPFPSGPGGPLADTFRGRSPPSRGPCLVHLQRARGRLMTASSSKARVAFKDRDVRRLIKAVRAEGLNPTAVEVDIKVGLIR